MQMQKEKNKNKAEKEILRVVLISNLQDNESIYSMKILLSTLHFCPNKVFLLSTTLYFLIQYTT